MGAVLTGVCAAPALGGSHTEIQSIGFQVVAQIKSVIVTIAWSGVVSVIALFIIDKTMGLRVSDEEEMMGLDQACHGESGYNS